MKETVKFYRMSEWASRRMGEEDQSPARPVAHSPIRANLPRGFSLIEIMVALTIIAILATIGIFGMKGLGGANKAKQTKATLGTLRGMLTEYENVTHFNTPPLQWEWAASNGAPSGIIVEPNYYKSIGVGAAVDFWRNPHINNSNAAYPAPDPLVAPPSVVDGMPDRYGSIAVINTQIVMNLLAAMPVNRATIQSQSNKVTGLLQWVSTNTDPTICTGGLTNGATAPYVPISTLPPSFGFGVCWNGGGTAPSMNGGTPSEVTNQAAAYVVGVEVAYTGSTPTTYWRWIQTIAGGITVPPSNATPPVGTTGDANWSALTTPPAPLLLDAWGNPIIFVPGSGLLVRSTSQANSTGQQLPVLVQSPDHKPFFASAGPDGDFSNGDDNIYSFED